MGDLKQEISDKTSHQNSLSLTKNEIKEIENMLSDLKEQNLIKGDASKTDKQELKKQIMHYMSKRYSINIQKLGYRRQWKIFLYNLPSGLEGGVLATLKRGFGR